MMMKVLLLATCLVPTLGANWAVIMAGSNTFGNYRHQSDACHAYQIAKKNGIPEDNIILLAYDDIAGSSENPFPGIEYNKPTKTGVAGVDVYKGCKISYRGENVTGENFMKVIAGDESASGPVLKSTKDDRVFIYFTDHGGVGILGVPFGAKGGYIHAKDLNAAIEKATYKELLFYLEACESGSIFKGLLKAPNAFAVTAANPSESSWGFYCPPNDTVSGKHVGSCLGDEFSINWLEDADVADFHTETVQTQVTAVTKKTNKSHVQQYGDKTTIPGEVIGDFEGKDGSRDPAPSKNVEDYSSSAVNQRDIELHLAYYSLTRARSQEEMINAQSKLEKLRANRASQDAMFSRIALSLEPNREMALELLEGPVNPHFPQHLDCHQAALKAVTQKCGPLDDYTMHYSRLFANLCSNHFNIGKIEAAVARECQHPTHPNVEPVLVDKTTFDFKGDEFHVLLATQMLGSFAAGDMYELTGHLAAEGGMVSVKCLNNTASHKCSHTAKFGEEYKPFPGRSPDTRRNFSATVGGNVYSGFAMFYMGKCADILYQNGPQHYMVVLPGPNPVPRPPPAPPTTCTSAFNQTGCAGMTKCVWCKSTDDVHELCFTKGHTPKKDWSCDSDEEVLVV